MDGNRRQPTRTVHDCRWEQPAAMGTAELRRPTASGEGILAQTRHASTPHRTSPYNTSSMRRSVVEREGTDWQRKATACRRCVERKAGVGGVAGYARTFSWVCTSHSLDYCKRGRQTLTPCWTDPPLLALPRFPISAASLPTPSRGRGGSSPGESRGSESGSK